MPKQIFKEVNLPREYPDCCDECPLLGIIPKHLLPKGSRETRLCVALFEAMTAMASRSRRSTKDSHHPLKHYCHDDWERWQEAPYFGKYPVRKIDYSTYIDPYIASQQRFIKFHGNAKN